MAGTLRRTNCILAKCSAYRKLLKTTVLEINISSNYCHSTSVSSKCLEDANKLNNKKKKIKSNNVLHGNISNTVNKTSFYDGNEVEVDSHNLQNLEAKDITKEELLDERMRRIKNKTFNHSLASYISICMYSGLYNLALGTFNHYRNVKTHSEDFESLNLKPYNEVLKGIALQGDLKKMKEVMESLEESSLEPDFNTIAYCLICLGRNENTPGVIDEIKSTLELMNRHKITLDEILGRSFFPRDSLEWCLRAIKRVIPDVEDKQQTLSSKDYILKENCYHNKIVTNLNDSIFTNQVRSPAEGVIEQDKLPEMIQRQIDNEINGFIEIPLCTRKSAKEHEEEIKLWEEWNEEWRKELSKALDKFRNFMSKKFSKPDSIQLSEFPYLNVLDNEDIINLLLQEVRSLCSADLNTVSYNQLAYQLGHKFYNRFEIRYKEKTRDISKLREVYEKYCKSYLLPTDTDASYIPRVEWNRILAMENHTMNWKEKPLEWPYTVKLSIGHKLHKFIFENLKVWSREGRPKKAFLIFRGDQSNKVNMKPTELLSTICSLAFENVFTLPTTDLPMLSPPVPWTDFSNGPFLFTSCNFSCMLCIVGVPKMHKPQTVQWLEEGKIQKLYPVLDSLTAAGSIPWKINSDMLDLVIEIFNKGGWSQIGICNSEFSKTVQPGSYLDEIRQRKHMRMERDSWVFQLQRLSAADYYRNSVFWMPHNVDYRSRSYTIGPYVSICLSDLYRSFLLFAQGKKLGQDGLTWLKLHIVNLTGKKKLSSIEDRLKYCEEVMDEIFDSAKNPLNGNKWWSKCGNPLQTLAACKELVAALESECPEEYVSHIPIHQDGSCNGLQHFSALGRDKEGAASVNLRSFDTPQDVYSNNIKLMEKLREEDTNKGNETAQFLKRFINRNVVKISVIANIYNNSETDAAWEIFPVIRQQPGFPEDDYNFMDESSLYLARKAFETLGVTFPSLKPIKDWLFKLVEGVSQHCLSNFEFESPVGYLISQPNVEEVTVFKWQADIIPSFVQGSVFLNPDLDYQKKSIGRNFILSLEASHMILTSLHCQKDGVIFASVHDSFWTHASTVALMNKICREQFVQLHSQPILEDLAQYFIQKYSTHPNYKHCYTTLSEKDSTPASLEVLLKNVPKKGDYDLNEVLRSTYFFS